MSQLAVRAALESQLKAMTPSLATAWENLPFIPPASTIPYQKAFVLFAQPDNPEWGPGYRELGYMQVMLMYPLSQGNGDATNRGDLIRTAFPKNSSLVNAGVVTTIDRTPEISNGKVDGDRWSVMVRIPFHANRF